MADLSGKESKEESLQTHGFNELRTIVLELFFSLNISAFLISNYVVLVRLFSWLQLWGLAVIVLVMGGYMVVLVRRRDRIGYLYCFGVGFGCSIALMHSL
jgi:hypothetical protein